MKLKMVENFWNKISSTGWKWSSLNAPSTETPVPVSHPLLGESLFPHSPLSGVIDNWTPQYESKKGGKLLNKSAPQAGNGPV